jgi:predicted 3-demethylubiquinone-9 3-methyltransferase (glyoxalase superfamily)
MSKLSAITPCLWFDSQAEDAAKFYVSIFPDSGIDAISRYGKEGFAGEGFTALNGGPLFKFSEAISFQISCDTQADIDRYWSALTAGGEEGACGWLKDRFGLSWQVVPAALPAMMSDPDPAKGERVMKAFMSMKKFDLAALKRAYDGK